MKWKIDDIPVFIAVVTENGITAAAQVLGMPKSTVSASLSRLEQGLGLRLLDRNSRNLRITAEGDIFYRQAQLIMEQVHEADVTAAGLNATPSGPLIAALPPAFALEIIAPHLASFHTAYPEIELEMIITGHGMELLRGKVDIAVVVGSQEDSDLISRTLLAGRLVWITSPAYFSEKMNAKDCENIPHHIQICEKRYGLKRLPVHIDGHASHIDLKRRITHVNNPLVVREAVINGAGVSVMPYRYCRDQIRNGSLVEINRHVTFDQEASKLVAVYPSRRLISPRLRVFLDFLKQHSR